MPQNVKAQRIRDPVHNLIGFGADQFEHTLWRVIQTPPFQRLRRIRQLGFSEFVFPGATHTRFAHSIGVFHTARQLMQIIRRHIGVGVSRQFKEHQANVALAASLVHDVGHGMFSHTFEEIGRSLNLQMAHHETVSEKLIRDSDIKGAFMELGSGFSDDVANVIKGGGQPGNLYDAVVSSQFDADRLDYMQRDRLMTGVQSSGIDVTWLMANLEVASVPIGADEESVGQIETLVLGPKAFQAAESFVLSLFQLYPNIYFHKATRAAEKVFAALMLRLIPLVRDGHGDRTGLPVKHPIRLFAMEPEKLENALALDDAVFWGAIPMMRLGEDRVIADYASMLWERRLPKCIDIRRWLEENIPNCSTSDQEARKQREAKIQLACKSICDACVSWSNARSGQALPILVDQTRRAPYRKFQESKTPLNQILIRTGNSVLDMAESSSVVSSAEAYEVCRVYFAEGDSDAKSAIVNIMRTNVGGTSHANT